MPLIFLKRIAFTLFMLSLLPALFGLYLICNPNFFVTVEHEFYRSAQLTPTQFDYAIKTYGIKSIINLRDAKPGTQWYDGELAVAKNNGIAHYSVGMSAQRILHKSEINRLLELFDTAEKPILVHCHGGADRTSLAAALYRLEVLGQSKELAKKEFSWKYMHFDWIKPAMLYFFNLYQGKEWAQNVYDPCKQNYAYYNKAKRCPRPS